MRTDRETRRIPACKFSLKMPQKPRNDIKSLKIEQAFRKIMTVMMIILITIAQTIETTRSREGVQDQPFYS